MLCSVGVRARPHPAVLPQHTSFYLYTATPCREQSPHLPAHRPRSVRGRAREHRDSIHVPLQSCSNIRAFAQKNAQVYRVLIAAVSPDKTRQHLIHLPPPFDQLTAAAATAAAGGSHVDSALLRFNHTHPTQWLENSRQNRPPRDLVHPTSTRALPFLSAHRPQPPCTCTGKPQGQQRRWQPCSLTDGGGSGSDRRR